MGREAQKSMEEMRAWEGGNWKYLLIKLHLPHLQDRSRACKHDWYRLSPDPMAPIKASWTLTCCKWVHAQSCLTPCASMDCSPPGSSVRGILQARKLEREATCLSRISSWPKAWTYVYCILGIGRRILHHWTTWEAPTCNKSEFSFPLSRGHLPKETSKPQGAR